MGKGRSSNPGALAEARAAAGASLRARQGELEQEALVKIHAVPAAPAPDAEYVVGRREAVAAALDCGLEVLEGRNPDTVPIPPSLLVQARMAARAGIRPETVICRYTVGHTLLNAAIVTALAAGGSLDPGWTQRLLAEQGALLNRVLNLVSEEYRTEATRQEQPRSRQQMLIHKLLAGGLVDPTELFYELDAWHIGVVASGSDVGDPLRKIAKQLDRRILLLDRGEGATWAWFGGQRRIGADRLEQAAAPCWPEGAFLTIGEPGLGLSGLRLTNKQARILVPLAHRTPRKVLRYAGHGLLSLMLQDDAFIESMRQLYLDPIQADHDGDRDLHRTLSAYFAAERNISSAATALEVARKTVSNRLERIEKRIGRPLSSCFFEIEAALALDRTLAGE